MFNLCKEFWEKETVLTTLMHYEYQSFAFDANGWFMNYDEIVYLVWLLLNILQFCYQYNFFTNRYLKNVALFYDLPYTAYKI